MPNKEFLLEFMTQLCNRMNYTKHVSRNHLNLQEHIISCANKISKKNSFQCSKLHIFREIIQTFKNTRLIKFLTKFVRITLGSDRHMRAF